MTSNGYGNPNALVSADWLEGHLDDVQVRIVEVDVSPKSYGDGHIPGAVLWDIYTMLKDPQYRLVDKPAVEEILRASGVGASTTVVFYGYGPVLGYWLLALYGHPNIAVLNLSKQQWHDDGRPWSTDRPQPVRTEYALPDPNAQLRALRPDVADSIGDPDCAILDVRSEAEYRGERFWPSGAPAPNGRAGHVPGALNVLLDGVTNADGSYASADALRRIFPAELDDASNVVTYCTIGNRASIAWFVLTQLLGRRGVRVYDGSWADWGFAPDTPVESAS